MEAEKSPSLLSANWKARTASGIIQSEYKGLRTRGTDGLTPNLRPKAWECGGCWCKSQSLKSQDLGALKSKGRKKKWTSQLKRKGNLSFFCFFVLFGPSTDWKMPTHIGWGQISLLSLLIQMLISSGSTLIHSPRNNVLPAIWSSLGPVKVTYKINHML